MQTKTALIFPPQWTPFQVYPSLPILQGYLRSHGEESAIFDANVQFYRYLLSAQFRAAALARAESALGVADAARRALLGAARQRLADGADAAAQVAELRLPAVYDDRARRRAALATWDRYLEAVSALYPPVQLSHRHLYLNLRTEIADLVRFCTDRADNLFLHYYMQELIPALAAFTPALVGISVVAPEQLIPALALCLALKAELPSAHVTLGGELAGLLLEERSPYHVFIGDCIDSVVAGAGEAPLRALIGALRAATPAWEVAGVTCRGDDGSLRRGAPVAAPVWERRADFTGLELGDYFHAKPIGAEIFAAALSGDERIQ